MLSKFLIGSDIERAKLEVVYYLYTTANLFDQYNIAQYIRATIIDNKELQEKFVKTIDNSRKSPYFHPSHSDPLKMLKDLEIAKLLQSTQIKPCRPDVYDFVQDVWIQKLKPHEVEKPRFY